MLARQLGAEPSHRVWSQGSVMIVQRGQTRVDGLARQTQETEDSSGPKNVRTEGLWIKCDSCRGTIWKKDLEANLMVCTECGFHFRWTRKLVWQCWRTTEMGVL